MDPVQKMWFYEHWLGNHRDNAELAKNHAYLLGSFSNPEAVQRMLNPNVHESSEEDFEESCKMVTEANLMLEEENVGSKKKKRRKKAKLVASQGKING
jgi:hypothetical protein